MDTKIIKQYGEEILSYRLRTARQKKRMQREDFDKQLIQLDKRRSELWRRKWNLGWEPLTPPVQKGWKRFFVLREEVARSKQFDFFQNILDKINTYDWSYRRDFKVKRRRFGKKIYVVKAQKLLEPDEHSFKKLCLSEAAQKLFDIECKMEKCSREPVKRYVFVEPWRFALRVAPNMIDKVRIKGAELESQIQQLDNYIERKNLQKRMHRLVGSRHRYRWGSVEKFDEEYKYRHKSLAQILNLIQFDEMV